ncbi:polyketide antibiotic transporter [Leucobacter sp. wl10]|uniref:polyketide antibiotic transporter n=1 Tax=Leucobacter sp. wl10 TaxID=2304677 RepID=UPI000E5B5E42|nr:polyketide antibiotic transporter [Leucobacter sp. wl10]RGE20008.1 polyketide antibiotic transporter [Leucobacter sp. wl10]
MIALLRLRLRRDRLQLPLWILGAVALAMAAVNGVDQTYGTESDRVEILAAVVANPVIMLFRGLPSGADRGAFTMFLILPFLAMMAAFMSSFLAVRHTRAEEEAGRAELVGAAPVGRIAPLAATIAHGALANLVLSALVAAVFLAAGLDATGCLVAAAATGAVGLAFLSVGLTAGQLMRTSRGANALAVWCIVIAFALSGVGNALGAPSDDLRSVESAWPAWLSPFGWAENARPFAADDPRPILLGLGLAALLSVAASLLRSVRDVGGGLIGERPGREAAPAALSSPLGLAWRLSRGSLIGWCAGGVLTGLLATSLASVIDAIGAEVPAVEQLTAALSDGGELAQGMVVIFFIVVGVLASCAAVQTVCRARQEEVRGTAELVLAAPVDRVRWLAATLAIALAAILLVTAAGVLGSVIGAVAGGDEWSLARDALVSGGGQAVAAAVFLALTALVFVVLPRATIPLGWTLVLLGLLLGLFGALFGLPDWIVRLSPVADVPTVSGGGIDVRGLWWLLLVAAAGSAASLALMRRRELEGDG